ncbi:MAG TPA: Hint domain-containing protein, partial [Archangium sp.]
MKNTVLAAASALALSSCGAIFCIARGALVSTPRGKRRIEDLVVGDTVWCIDPETGERVEAPLVHVRAAKREIMRLEGEGFSLRCTTDHPLYDPVAKEWSAAGDWVLGKRSALLLIEEG